MSPTNPFYNRGNAITAHNRARAEDVAGELANIQAGFTAVYAAMQQLQAGGSIARYTHYAYADSADGTDNFTTGLPEARTYVGIFANSPSATASINPADYVWSLFAGASGQSLEMRYIRAASPPARPAFGEDPPAGSTLIPVSGTDPLWFTVATRDGAGNLVSAWTAWQRLTDYMPVDYRDDLAFYRDSRVLHKGGTYILIVDSSLGNAPSGTAQANAYWAVISAPGDSGTPATPPSAFSATINLTTATGINLRTLADAAGYTGKSDATITFNVPNGVTITGQPGAPDGGIGIDSGTWPSSEYTVALTLVVQNGGTVRGGGGKGGTDGGSGGKGGDAIYLRENFSGGITIDSGGKVQAGGGGGGSGLGPVDRGTTRVSGGGGGVPNGPGGEGAGEFMGATGQPGTEFVGGIGGVGPGSGNGGQGGQYATHGNPAFASQTNGTGGAAGYAVRKNGKTATVTNNGTMAGAAA